MSDSGDLYICTPDQCCGDGFCVGDIIHGVQTLTKAEYYVEVFNRREELAEIRGRREAFREMADHIYMECSLIPLMQPVEHGRMRRLYSWVFQQGIPVAEPPVSF